MPPFTRDQSIIALSRIFAKLLLVPKRCHENVAAGFDASFTVTLGGKGVSRLSNKLHILSAKLHIPSAVMAEVSS
jgi:hypothetical protein